MEHQGRPDKRTAPGADLPYPDYDARLTWAKTLMAAHAPLPYEGGTPGYGDRSTPMSFPAKAGANPQRRSASRKVDRVGRMDSRLRGKDGRGATHAIREAVRSHRHRMEHQDRPGKWGAHGCGFALPGYDAGMTHRPSARAASRNHRRRPTYGAPTRWPVIRSRRRGRPSFGYA